MDRESFIETLREQYAEEIQEAYLECEHADTKSVEWDKLKPMIKSLMKSAMANGLPKDEFIDVLNCTLPDVAEKVGLRPQAA